MTPNLEPLRDLLVKARAAKEGSRELDEAVRGVFPNPADDGPFILRPFTTRPLDLTAVVGLLPERWHLHQITNMRDGSYIFQVCAEHTFRCFAPSAPTIVLALLIAVIEAHIYELENGND